MPHIGMQAMPGNPTEVAVNLGCKEPNQPTTLAQEAGTLLIGQSRADKLNRSMQKILKKLKWQ